MARKRGTTAAPVATGARLVPPKGGATVRMYRTGHGDCFLLAFPGEEKPVYVLIDCGYKPGSPKFINTSAKEITASIREATGGHIDVAVITHEHQDHVNAITKENFAGITIGETWLAWTEDHTDTVANALRSSYKDKLLGLVAARNRLAAEGDGKRTEWLDDFLSFELGGGNEVFDAAAAGALLGAAPRDPLDSMNKKSMKVFKDLAKNGVQYIRPHEQILALPGVAHVRVFALGPPRDGEKLRDLDPEGEEEFHGMRLAGASSGTYFAAAAADRRGHGMAPFASRYAVAQSGALEDGDFGVFFTDHYGSDATPPRFASDDTGRPGRDPEKEAADNPAWRRIDREWLYSAEQLALDLSDYTNNTSLVLAFELGRGGKVLLFAADAQRGNWLSWSGGEWKDGADTVSVRDLLARTVLYKVGHHGSHNATLNGLPGDEHANLAWMAHGNHSREFTAMITAVRKWAETKKGWDHPLKAIKDALLKKASGRVIQTDTDVEAMQMPDGALAAEWKHFRDRVRGHRLYFDYDIHTEAQTGKAPAQAAGGGAQ